MEYFDIESFKKHISSSGNSAEYIKEDGTRVSINKNILGEYVVFETPPPPALFLTFKEFYKNLSLKIKETRFIKTEFRVELAYEYDENGKVIKMIDYDKPFTYTLNDVLKYCNDNKIDVQNTRTFIDRSNPPKKEGDACVWIIRYLGIYDNKHGGFIEIILDGKTGEKLKVTIQKGKGEEGTKVETLYDVEDVKNKTLSIYKIHEGKNYTKVEWEAYEEKQYEEYCKRTGKPYTPKKQDIRPESQDKKSPFLAQDGEKGNQDTPKINKKGFWDNLFG